MILLKEASYYSKISWYRGHFSKDVKADKRSTKTAGTGFWFTSNPYLAASYALGKGEGFVSKGIFRNLVLREIDCKNRNWSSIEVDGKVRTTDETVRLLFSQHPSLEAVLFSNIVDRSSSASILNYDKQGLIKAAVPSSTLCVRELVINKFGITFTKDVKEFILTL